MQEMFPGGVVQMGSGASRLERDLGSKWPEDKLWLVSQDLRTGKRVVIGKDPIPEMSLHRAVRASAAIPGIYPPVKCGDMSLVDGGAGSTTHMDLAIQNGIKRIIVIAPMAYDPANPPAGPNKVLRNWPMKMLMKELTLAKKAGIETHLFLPSAKMARIQGINLMRADVMIPMAEAAYQEATKYLATVDLGSMPAA
ncbi:MAG: hypothetical protein HKL80_08840 [Acidimicrobiales bacterium]|nr:hypothetical protein [Acidimicrobiales bacterium]